MAHLGGPGGHPPPPPDIEDQQEMFFPPNPTRVYPLDLGVAFGITAMLFMITAIAISLAVSPAGMQFFEDIFVGFDIANMTGRIIGLIWSFGTGFVLGTFTGFFYNWRLRRYVVRTHA